MLDAWNRVEHYRDLGEECRRLAASTLSSRMTLFAHGEGLRPAG
jgi:hypothetical protein